MDQRIRKWKKNVHQQVSWRNKSYAEKGNWCKLFGMVLCDKIGCGFSCPCLARFSVHHSQHLLQRFCIIFLKRCSCFLLPLVRHWSGIAFLSTAEIPTAQSFRNSAQRSQDLPSCDGLIWCPWWPLDLVHHGLKSPQILRLLHRTAILLWIHGNPCSS